MSPAFAALPHRLQRPLWSFLPICTIALVIGFTGELLILGPNITLERNAAAGWTVGWSTALQAAGIVASTPLAVFLLGRTGSAQVFGVGGLLCFCALAALCVSGTAVEITLCRFVFAIGLGILVIVSQHVVMARAPVRAKGITLALFGSFVSIGSALVPTFIRYVEADLSRIYLGGLVGILVAILCAASVCRRGRAEAVSPRQPWTMVSRIGMPSFSSGLFYGVLTNGCSALLANYAMRAGYSVADASAIVMAGLTGTFVLELPLGWLCDRYRPSGVLGGCAAIVIGLMLLVILLSPGLPVLLTLAFLLGGLGSAFYLVGLIEMAGVKSTELAAGTASFILACGLGEMTGPLVGGFALEAFGSDGFLIVFLAILIAYFVLRTGASAASSLSAVGQPAPAR